MDCVQRIRQAATLIREAKRITPFTGAGVSTGSGISDFRSPGGVWEIYRVVTLQEFLSNHEARVEYRTMKKELFLETTNAKPNRAHLALPGLKKRGNSIVS